MGARGPSGPPGPDGNKVICGYLYYLFSKKTIHIYLGTKFILMRCVIYVHEHLTIKSLCKC